MEQPNNAPRSPNEVLAEIISEKLLSEGLILSSKKEEVQKKLANGTARQDDWPLWMKIARDERKEEEGEHAEN